MSATPIYVTVGLSAFETVQDAGLHPGVDRTLKQMDPATSSLPPLFSITTSDRRMRRRLPPATTRHSSLSRGRSGSEMERAPSRYSVRALWDRFIERPKCYSPHDLFLVLVSTGLSWPVLHFSCAPIGRLPQGNRRLGLPGEVTGQDREWRFRITFTPIGNGQ